MIQPVNKNGGYRNLDKYFRIPALVAGGTQCYRGVLIVWRQEVSLSLKKGYVIPMHKYNICKRRKFKTNFTGTQNPERNSSEFGPCGFTIRTLEKGERHSTALVVFC